MRTFKGVVGLTMAGALALMSMPALAQDESPAAAAAMSLRPSASSTKTSRPSSGWPATRP